jgi:hypothetical protein
LLVCLAASGVALVDGVRVKDSLTESVAECANITAFLHDALAHLFAFNALLFMLLEDVERTALLLEELSHVGRLQVALRPVVL